MNQHNTTPIQPLEWDALFSTMEKALLSGNRGWVETTEEMYHDQLNSVPPAAYKGSSFMVGEEWACIRGRNYHAAYKVIGSRYFARYMALKEFNAPTFS